MGWAQAVGTSSVLWQGLRDEECGTRLGREHRVRHKGRLPPFVGMDCASMESSVRLMLTDGLARAVTHRRVNFHKHCRCAVEQIVFATFRRRAVEKPTFVLRMLLFLHGLPATMETRAQRAIHVLVVDALERGLATVSPAATVLQRTRARSGRAAAGTVCTRMPRPGRDAVMERPAPSMMHAMGLGTAQVGHLTAASWMAHVQLGLVMLGHVAGFHVRLVLFVATRPGRGAIGRNCAVGRAHCVPLTREAAVL